MVEVKLQRIYDHILNQYYIIIADLSINTLVPGRMN